MFTGLVEAQGTVREKRFEGPGVRFLIDAGSVSDDVALGDSVAINGCCLTVVARNGQELAFEAGSETLSRTNLGELLPGSRVNLERSLRVGDRLGGHFVAGHVDALGTLVECRTEGEWSFYWFRVPPSLTKQMASKGSVAVDGVSLTLVEVTDDCFSVALIPHTLSHTTLGQLSVGAAVNIETDLLAKYVQRQLNLT
jgi:riboflavin synthase